MPSMKTAFFTICSRNYLAFALTLRQSVLRAEPDHAFYIFLADEAADADRLSSIEVIPVAELERPEIASMALRYTIMEFNTAIKPFCFEHLFRKLDFEAAIYLDPDIEVFQPLTLVHAHLQSGASCVLTPHILEPIRDDDSPSDIDILRSGTFNLGFAAFARTPEAERFLSWWARRLTEHCFVDLERGLFVDQKFAELAPSFISALSILRDPGYNVAYWNLMHRTVDQSGKDWQVNGLPLTFFHYSGVIAGEPGILSKHQTRFATSRTAGVEPLIDLYLQKLAAHDHLHWSKIPYAFSSGPDGTRIPDPIRRHLPRERTIRAPLTPSDIAFWNAPSERVDQTSGKVITRLMLSIYESRPDLREVFALATAGGRHLFHAWFLTHGATEYGLSPIWTEPAFSTSRPGTLSRHLSWLQIRLAQARRRIIGN